VLENHTKLGSGQMFDSIAEYYDILNQILSLNNHMTWKNTLVSLLDIQENDYILDMSTGTGDIAILIAENIIRKKYTNAKVNAIDPSNNMLIKAMLKSSQKNVSDYIMYRVGDATNLVDIPEGTYSKITMSFGIRNIPDRKKALKELKRVLKPKSSDKNPSLYIMEFVSPQKGFLAPVAQFFIAYFVPLLGTFFANGHSSEYRHLSDSILNFPEENEFVKEIIDSDFSSCSIKNIFFHVVIVFICQP